MGETVAEGKHEVAVGNAGVEDDMGLGRTNVGTSVASSIGNARDGGAGGVNTLNAMVDVREEVESSIVEVRDAPEVDMSGMVIDEEMPVFDGIGLSKDVLRMSSIIDPNRRVILRLRCWKSTYRERESMR